MLVDNLFYITPILLLSIIENNHVSLKRKVANTNHTFLWHLSLGHINLNSIQRLVKSGSLHSLVPKDLPVYESFIEGNMTKRSFTLKGVLTQKMSIVSAY